MDKLLRLVAVAHVVLDPFPVSDMLSVIQALAIGVPVITLPSEELGGRYALGLYQMLDYGLKEYKEVYRPLQSATLTQKSNLEGSSNDSEVLASTSQEQYVENEILSVPSLVALTPTDYISTAISIAHQPKLRDAISSELLSDNRRRRLLFDRNSDETKLMINEWKSFFSQL